MSSYPALELPDVHRVQSLFVVPSSRNSIFVAHNNQGGGGGNVSQHAGMQRLAPIEMAAQSIHLASSAQQTGFMLSSNGISLAGKKGGRDIEAGKPSSDPSSSSAASGSGCCHDFSSPAAPSPVSKPWIVPVGLVVPLGYACCGAGLCLCHLMAPGYLHACALLLSPLWTLTLGLHAVGMHDLVWLWLGLLTILLLPSAILVSDLLFVAFYLGVLAIFASGRFWQNLKGVPFLMVSLCWFGLSSSLVLSAVLQDHQSVTQLAVATFFALAAGTVSASQLPKITIASR